MNSPSRPHLGAFITMTVGLLLFFGSLSQVGKLTDTKDLLSAPSSKPVETSPTDELMRKRQEAVAVIGGRTSRPEYLEDESSSATGSRRTATPPAPTTNQNGNNRNVQPPQEPRNNPVQRSEPQMATLPAERARHYEVKESDTLYRIAKLAYGDGNKWTLIRDANPQINPAALRPGQNLLIPALPSAQQPADVRSAMAPRKN